MTRRAPDPDQRRLDPERTRARLLGAAFEEFAEHGYAGARVSRIAERAGVNKQLISYHFGGKAGLFRALARHWWEQEAEFAGPEIALDELIARYAQRALADPRGIRLSMWQSLAADESPVTSSWGSEADIERMRLRRDRGELAGEFDPAAALLMVIGAVCAPVLLRDTVRELFDSEPDDPRFREHYIAQLRVLAAALRRV